VDVPSGRILLRLRDLDRSRRFLRHARPGHHTGRHAGQCPAAGQRRRIRTRFPGILRTGPEGDQQVGDGNWLHAS